MNSLDCSQVHQIPPPGQPTSLLSLHLSKHAFLCMTQVISDGMQKLYAKQIMLFFRRQKNRGQTFKIHECKGNFHKKENKRIKLYIICLPSEVVSTILSPMRSQNSRDTLFRWHINRNSEKILVSQALFFLTNHNPNLSLNRLKDQSITLNSSTSQKCNQGMIIFA